MSRNAKKRSVSTVGLFHLGNASTDYWWNLSSASKLSNEVMSSSHVAVTSSTHRAGSREAHMHVRVLFFDHFHLICCRVMDIWPCWLCRSAALTMEQDRLRFLGPTRAWWHQVVPGQPFIRPAANLSCLEAFCPLFYYFWFLSSRVQDCEDVRSNSWPSHRVLFNAFHIFS